MTRRLPSESEAEGISDDDVDVILALEDSVTAGNLMSSSTRSGYERVRRFREEASERLWPTGALYVFLALATTVLSERRSHYVADNRFEQYFNPARSISKMFAVWDGSRGLGGPREDVWLGTTIPPMLLRWVGLSPASTERVFHAACLVAVGLGVVALVRIFRPRIGGEHVIAGLLTMFGPFSSAFLLPSNLYMMFVVSPWLVLVLVRGLTTHRPWRWAAIFALIVMFAGNSDIPGLAYIGVMLLVSSLYLVLVERAARVREVALWFARAVVLSVACSAWMLAKTYYAAEPLDARLADTELPTAYATSSSWSESFRGLGNWLSYFAYQGRLAKPQGALFLEDPWVIVATFVPAIVALVVLWRSRDRWHLLFGAMLLAGVVTMVGGFGVPNASPLGRAILWTFDHVNVLKSFRNTYKGAGGLVIGVSVLAGIGAVTIHRWCSARSRALSLVSTLAGCVLLLTLAAPFTRAEVYQTDEQVGSIPAYWTSTFEYLDSLPAGGRSLIVPAVSQAAYRWGYVGDDILDASTARPHAAATGWMLSTRTGHNALEQVTLLAQDPAYRPGALAAMARRLGITEVVIRNDLEWAELQIARPSAFKPIRSDPDFQRIGTFGAVGLNVTSADDTSNAAEYERTLPPVEVYGLRHSAGLVDLERSSPADTVVVSGDAGGWPELEQADLLGPSTGVVASAALSDGQLRDALGHGASVVVTDTGRRRVRTLLHHEPELSPTLSAGQDLGRPVRPVYPGVAGGESIAWYRDALTITGTYATFGGNRNDNRAALAFDEDPNTAWAIPWLGTLPRPSVTVSLRGPTAVNDMVFQSTVTPEGVPTVTGVDVEFADGSTVPVQMDRTGRAEVRFAGNVTSSVTIVVTDLGVLGPNVGLAEVSIGQLDLVEHIQLANDMLNRNDPAVSAALQQSDVAYTFGRSVRVVSAAHADPAATWLDEEKTIQRRFDVVHADTFNVKGSIRLSSTTSDGILSTLLGGDVNAIATRPATNPFDGPAVLALDRDQGTWWEGGARVGDTFTVEIPRQALTSVRVTQPNGVARIDRMSAVVGGRRVTSVFGPVECTDPASGPDPSICSSEALFTLPEGLVDNEVTLQIESVDQAVTYNPGLVRLSEVAVSGSRPNRLDLGNAATNECVDLGLRVGPQDGPLEPVLVRVKASVGEVLDRDNIEFDSCEPLAVPAGAHLLQTEPGSMFDQIALVPVRGFATAPPTDPVEFEWAQISPDRIDATLPAVGPVTLTMRGSFDPLWRLEIDGKSVPAVERDAGNSWSINVEQPTSVSLVYAPSMRLRQAMIVSLAAMVLCVVLAVRARRPTLIGSEPGGAVRADGTMTMSSAMPRYRRDAVAIVASTMISVALAGPWAIAIGIVTLVIIRPFPDWRLSIGLAPPMLLGAAAIWSALIDQDGSLNGDYANRRWAPSALAALAVVFLFQSIALAGADAGRSRPRPRSEELCRWRRRTTRFEVATALPVMAISAVAAIAAAVLTDTSTIPTELISSLRLSGSYSLQSANVRPALGFGPIPPALVAFAPFSQAVLEALAAAAFVVLTSMVAARWRRPLATARANVVAAALVAGTIVVAVHSFPVQLALALVMAAVVVAKRPGAAPACAFASGALLAAAILCRPEAIVVIVIIAAPWYRSGRLGWLRILAMLAGASAAAPWFIFASDRDGTTFSLDDHDPLVWVASVASAAVCVGGARLISRRRRGSLTQ